MLQPRPLLLAQHLRGAADQCALLEDLPAVNNARMLKNIMDAVTDINTRLTTMYALTLFSRDLRLILILCEAKI